MSEEYADILIRILRWDDEAGTYPVEVELDNGAFFSDGALSFDQQLRQALLTADLDPEKYGLELFYALFSGPVRRAYDTATGRAEADTEGRLRVRLWIDTAAAELHAIPWERLYHVHKGQTVPLSTSALTPFSRYIGLPIPEPQPITARPIRLLVAISNPKRLKDDLDLTPVDVAQEIENLCEALSDLRRGGQLEVTFMPGQSGIPSGLRAQLEREGYRVQDGTTGLNAILDQISEYHALHFVGHGFFRREREDGRGSAALYLERGDGRWKAVTDQEVVVKLAATDPLPYLVFLSACESAKTDGEHPFVGLGPRLIQVGIPAVVAMQDKVPMETAQQLTRGFYRHLLRHGTIDESLNRARLLLFDQERTDWAIPVLFMRLEKGQLFAADPVGLALQAIRAHKPYRPWAENEYLPIEAVHLVGRQDAGSLRQIHRESAPSLDLVEATLNLFSARYAAAQTRDDEADATRMAGEETRFFGKNLVSADSEREKPLLVALVGDHGTAKTTQLRRIAWATADRSLQPDAVRQIVPIYVNLLELDRRVLAASGRVNPVESLVFDGLRHFWPGLTREQFSDLLDQDCGPTLRVLIDGSDDLPGGLRRQAWRAIQALVGEHPRHEYMLAVDPDYFDPDQLDVTDLLVIQPLSQRKTEQFLRGLDSPTGRRLYGALARAQLFDLAASPWLLVKMLDQARDGIYPQSRTAVLQSLVEDAITSVPLERGMQSRAERTLYALAWDMQSARSSTWAMSDALRTMATIRGNREYSLEALYEALVGCGLLAQVGPETMRFVYPTIRAYCCARAILDMDGRDQILDDITATLGRLTRLRWWEDTLVLLSGLMPDPTALIKMLLYGAALAEGEQAFLAARCLVESRHTEVPPDMVSQVVDALVWHLDCDHERSITRRVRAAQALGQLGQAEWLSPEAGVPPLARVANQKVRLNWRDELTYEYSSVRMAAAVALQRLGPEALNHVDAIDSQLCDAMALWRAKEVEGLGEVLHAGEGGIQAIAAFALGDIRTEQAVDLLVETFLEPEIESETRWAATDALALMDPAVVTRRAILPLLDKTVAEREGIDRRTWNRRNHWYERIAYLIGRIRAQHPETRAFLDRCLYQYTGVWLKAKAIHALGCMYESSYKELFEQIAVGDFSGVATREHLSGKENLYLRRKAIQALATVGDRYTLARLRADRTDWGPQLERAFYWTSEEIHWRMSLGGEQ